MKRLLPLLLIVFLLLETVTAQNVFNPSDAIIRYDKNQPQGSAQNPDTAKKGLQKWVSTPTTGVSLGSAAWDASSFKAYYINAAGAKMAFRIKFPSSYTINATKKYPVMLFLHGAGEPGCNTNGGIYNNEKQLWLGGSLFKSYVDNGSFDGFLVYPQLVTTSADCWAVWGTTISANYTAVFAMIDSLGKHARANIDRLVVDGLSGGAFGAWRAASAYPTRVATILPSANAGGGFINNRAAFVHIPIWFATGGKDPNPSPSQSQYTVSRMKEVGAEIRYTLYPDHGHNMWYNHWREPDFVTAMNDAHKANPLVFFQKSEYCTGETVNSKLGITPAYYAYEWQKDGVTIATRTNGVNTIVNSTAIISFTGNEITINSLGTYRVRFKRNASAAWSDWSPKPAVIKLRSSESQAAPITVAGLKSKVLPALDGSTTVPLTMPSGYINYDWRRVSDNVQVSTAQIYNAPAGVYKAKYDEREGCGPAYSPNFTVVNANGSPKPDPATNLTITSLSATSIRLNWGQNLNESGFEVYRGTSKGGPYQLLSITGANITSYTDNTLSLNTTYYYVVRSVNNTGAAATSNEVSPNNGNTPPVIGSTLTNIYAKTGSTTSRTFTVTDNADDIVTVSILAQPAFVTLTKITDTDYTITVNASMDNLGWTELRVLAEDNNGMSAMKTITVHVTNGNTKSVYVNLGSSSKAAPAPWNNWLGTRSAGSVISNLKDETNVATTIGLTAVNAWTVITTLGHSTGNNSGVVPDVVLESGIADNSTARQIKVSGLNTSKRYNLVFIGSQNEGNSSTTQYSANGQASILNSRYNTQESANLNSLVPDASGNILVTITRTGSTAFTYLNGMIIEEYSPSITLLNPENLSVEPINRQSVLLTWSDKTNNEDGYEITRSTDPSFSSGVATIRLARNSTNYKNTGLAPNTKYYYRVRAKNGTTYSGSSNVVATITPTTMIYVNFNTTVPNGPSPWNNLEAITLSPFTSGYLKNEFGTSTMVRLKLESPFNGEFNAGVTTGNNSGVVPDNVLKANYWMDKQQISQFRVTGLLTSRRYRFGFFGSASSNGWSKGNYTGTYTIGDRTVYLNAWMNSTKIVYIGDVQPSSTGEVLITFSTTGASTYGFHGGLLIENYADASGGTVLNAVLEEPVDTRQIDVPEFKIFIYPNPFIDHVNVNFNNNSSQNRIVAELYDLSGKLTYRYDFQRLPAGSNTLVLNVPEYSGETHTYILALKVNGKVVHSSKLLRSKH